VKPASSPLAALATSLPAVPKKIVMTTASCRIRLSVSGSSFPRRVEEWAGEGSTSAALAQIL
jgi:hypothetical protein